MMFRPSSLRYKLYEEEPWYSQELRYFSIDNYLVFYKVNDEIGKVYVVRIMYGGRDIRTQLNKSQIQRQIPYWVAGFSAT